MQRTTYLATMPSRRYPSTDASEQALRRGLAVTREGPAIGGAVQVSIIGARADVERWLEDFEGTLTVATTTTTTPRPLSPNAAAIAATRLVLLALESYGSDALLLADQARAMVGAEGIESIAHALADAGDTETAWTIRGALAALLGDPAPPEIGGEYESEARDGYDFVAAFGSVGYWSE